MKGFFKQHSYSIVKNLVNQIVISIFGAFLSIIAMKTDLLSIIVSAFAIVFYLFLIYTTTWEIGAKDRISVDVGKKKYNPQQINPIPEPCQSPVKSQVTNRFTTVLALPLLLPPRGIYTYSLNHEERVMCHLRQNSVMLFEI